jgi:hypothetical protein
MKVATIQQEYAKHRSPRLQSKNYCFYANLSGEFKLIREKSNKKLF